MRLKPIIIIIILRFFLTRKTLWLRSHRQPKMKWVLSRIAAKSLAQGPVGFSSARGSYRLKR